MTVEASLVPGRPALRDLAARPRVRRAVGAALFLLSAALLVAIVTRNADQLGAAPWRLVPIELLAGFALQLATLAIGTYVWIDVSAAFGAPLDRRRAARVYALSLLAKRLPGGFWHVVGRTAYYGDAGLGRRVGVGGSLVEMGLLVVTGGAVALVALGDLGLAGPVAGLALLAAGPWMVRVVVARIAGHGPSGGPLRLYRWAALDVLAWLVGCAGVYLQIDAVYPLTPAIASRLVAATTGSIVLSSLVLVLPSGLGLRELGFVGMTGGFLPPGVATALAVGLRVVAALLDVVWALVAIVLSRPRAREEAA